MRHTTRFTATAIAIVLSSSGVAAAQDAEATPAEVDPMVAETPAEVIGDALEDAGVDPEVAEALEDEIADEVEDLMDAGVIDDDDIDDLADAEGRPERITEHVERQQARRAERQATIDAALAELGVEVADDANPAEIREALREAGVERDEIKDLMRPQRPERPEHAQADKERPERGVDRDDRERPDRGPKGERPGDDEPEVEEPEVEEPEVEEPEVEEPEVDDVPTRDGEDVDQ